MRHHRVLVLLLALVPFTSRAAAQDAGAFWPGASYDPAIPTFESVLGHPPGARIVSHAAILRYLEALARAAPDRIQVAGYARSWEGRLLVYAAIGSKENIARLDALKDGMRKFADPATPADEVAARLDDLPAFTWLAYGVHGNEISGPDAALLTAYHLLAATGDPIVDAIRADSVVFLDPTQNPDGRDRFVHHHRQSSGIQPDLFPDAAEHDEPWPGGRTNHYLFDLNRDWFAMTQPETIGRVRLLREWTPLVFVDLHEMGRDSTYYFAPEAVPYNPHLAADQRADLERFGRNNARWFDRFGFEYFTREVYDAFYPGYGASWPSYYGAVAMTYEQASARGLAVRRADGTDLKFVDGVRHHFVASISTAEAAARDRRSLLEHFRAYRESAVEAGRTGPVKAHVFPAEGDVSLVDRLAGLLALQGVDVRRARRPFEAAGRSFAAGSVVVPMDQPAHRLLRTLLDPDVPMDEAFLAEQERRRAKGLRDEIYDVTAWSLPLQFNVARVGLEEAADVPDLAGDGFEAVPPALVRPGTITGGAGDVAFLVPGGSVAAVRFLCSALRAGLRVDSTDHAFTQGDRTYPAGTLIVKTKEHPAELRETVARLAATTGAEVVATDTGWVEDGPNFGSRKVVRIPAARVALAWDAPTSGYSAGAARYVLERQFGYPVTPIRVERLPRAELSRFDVLVLPEGRYRGRDGAALKEFVEEGGVVVALGSATSFLADPAVGLLDVAEEQRAEEGAPDAKASKKDGEDRRTPGRILATEEEYEAAIRGKDVPPDTVPGVLARAVTDPDHWLCAGAAPVVNVLVRGRTIYEPLRLDQGVNAVRFAGPDDLLASGYLWEENRRQLAFKPFALVKPHGRGLVVAFTADPNVRAYLDGLNVLFLNAIFRGAAHARPPR